MNKINILDYSSCGRDQRGRKFPIHLVLLDGTELYGHIEGSIGLGSQTDEFVLAIIPNIQQWVQGVSSGTRSNVKIKVASISNIRVFKY